MCTGNSCRSIFSEAIINHDLYGSVKAYSSGIHPSDKVSSTAKKILEMFNMWDNNYHSKPIESVANINFDLVVTVCGNAKEQCPNFSKGAEIIHIGFDDPDGKDFDYFLHIFHKIRKKLIPIVRKKLC